MSTSTEPPALTAAPTPATTPAPTPEQIPEQTPEQTPDQTPDQRPALAAPPPVRRGSFLERHPHLTRSVWRRFYVAVNPHLFPTVHVNEFPKSGGTWLCRMLRDCLGWRFDDNRFPRPGKAVVKHHRLGLILPRMVVLVRDPRDTLVSFFHHNRDTFTGDAFNHGAVRLYGKALFEGLTDDPGAMIRRFVEVAETRPVSPAFTWRAFYQAALDRGGHIVRYEDLRADPAAVLGGLFEALGVPVEPGRIAEVTRQHDIGHILAAREKADRGKGRTGDSKTGDGKTGDGKTGDGKTGDSRTGDDKTGDGKAGHHFIRRGKIGGYQDELDTETIALIERNNAALMQRLGYA